MMDLVAAMRKVITMLYVMLSQNHNCDSTFV